MKIEKYEMNKKGDYNIYLSSGEVITLTAKVITDNELLLKKEIDEELYKKLLFENEINLMYNIAVKYITVRLRSVKEIKVYLKKKTDDERVINCVIEKLINEKILDDNKFAKAFIKDKLNFSKKGDYKIREELKNLGVSETIIEENLSMIDNSLIEERIRKQIEKDIRTNKKYTGQTLKNKIYNHLVSAGYSKEKVISIINTYDF